MLFITPAETSECGDVLGREFVDECGKLCLICTFAGNWLGDSKTFIDCAERGQAQMVGAGTIICSVVKKGGE